MAGHSYIGHPALNASLSTGHSISGTMAKTNTRTCHTCKHSKDVLHGGDGKTTIAMCGLEPDPVSGQPIQLCKTQRLVGNVERSIAIRAAEMLGICGPLGTMWEEGTPPPPKTPWYKSKKT